MYPNIDSDAIVDDGGWVWDKLLAIFQINLRVFDTN